MNRATVAKIVENIHFSDDEMELASRFSWEYRQDMMAIRTVGGRDKRPPCMMCRDKVIWFCAVTENVCNNFVMYLDVKRFG